MMEMFEFDKSDTRFSVSSIQATPLKRWVRASFDERNG